MSKKIDIKKLTQMANGTSSTAKGVVIGEKCPRYEVPDISLMKKGKKLVDIKKRRAMPPPEEKKKAQSKSKSTPR